MKKFFLLIGMFACMFAGAQTVTLNRNGATVGDLMQQLQREYGYSFSLASDVVDVERTVATVNIKEGSIEDAISTIFYGQNVDFEVRGKMIIVSKASKVVPSETRKTESSGPETVKTVPETLEEPAPAESKPQTPPEPQEESNATVTVSGRIVDEMGEALMGAGIKAKNGSAGTVSGLNGDYSIKVAGNDVLVFTFLGYVTKEVPVKGKTSLDVNLLPDNNYLDDVVVIGYGTSKKSDLTGAVATVKMSDIEESGLANIDQALQGKVAGMDVMTTGGAPGAATSIRIRGSRSINASNEPLIVVDGVIDAVNDIGDIDPATVESISVLKDASSTAIYGSRGANGVILVTTRKATSSKVSLNASFKYGISRLARNLDIMNAKEYIQYKNDGYYVNRYIAGDTEIGERYTYDPDGADTNWIKEITRTAFMKSANVSLSQNISKNLNVYGSVGWVSEEGIVKATAHDRLSVNTKIIKTFNKWLELTYNMSISSRRQDKNVAIISGTNYTNGAIYLSPLIGVDDYTNPLVDGGTTINNPVQRVNNIENTDRIYSRTDAVKLIAKPVDGLRINAQLTPYRSFIHTYQFQPSTLPTRHIAGSGAYAYRYEWQRMILTGELTANYVKSIRKIHNFDLMGGFTSSKTDVETMAVAADGLVSDNLKWKNLNAIGSKENYNVTSNETHVVKESAFARLNYNYKKKYYLTVTGRLDGSSSFAENHKWGFFPSAALKWNAKTFAPIRRAGWIKDLSVRGSVGLSGNDAISAYRSLQAYASSTSYYIFDGVQEANLYPSRLANPDLTWEKTLMYNGAIEASFFNGRISATLESYKSLTRDLLLSVTTVASTGYTSRFVNLGRTSNKGFEFSLDTHNIERQRFGWTTSFTISHNDQMVSDIGKEDYVALVKDVEGYMMYGYKAGYPLNSLWGFQYEGVWHSSDEFNRNAVTHNYASYRNSYNASTCLGRPRFADTNHDGVLNNDDLIYLGQADPDVAGGLKNDFYFGKLKIGIYFAYSFGGKIYNYSELLMAGTTQSNQYRYMKDCWHPVKNPDSNLPRADASSRFLCSSFAVHDASYVRLKTLSVNYTFDLSRRWRWARSLTLGVSGDNLFLWAPYNGFDPDVSTNNSSTSLRRVDMNAYPRARMVVFSAQLKL